MDLPKPGTAARKLYDHIHSQKDGTTQDKMGVATGLKDNMVAIRLAELADKGLVVKDGQRMAGPEEQVAMDIWRAAVPGESSGGDPAKPRKPPAPAKLSPQACPACGATVYQHLTERGVSVYVDPQKRLVAFAGPPELYDENGLPKKPLNVYDDFNGQLCFGREVEEDELEHFKEYKKLRVPYTIGYEWHLKSCTRWDRWMSGEAEKTEKGMDLKWDYESKRMEFVKRAPHSFSKSRAAQMEKKSKGKKMKRVEVEPEAEPVEADEPDEADTDEEAEEAVAEE